MRFTRIPKLYAILDGETVRTASLDLFETAVSLRDAGVSLVQYRDKQATQSELLQRACAIRALFTDYNTTLILNDWPEIALAAGFDGVHVGQSDVAVEESRRVLGTERLIGVSTHTSEQFLRALDTDADYLAYGPIFITTTKQDAESPVGLKGLREVRTLSSRPLVAIGGISQDRMKSVFDAGADSVAVIGALYKREQPVLNLASELMQAAERSTK